MPEKHIWEGEQLLVQRCFGKEYYRLRPKSDTIRSIRKKVR
jgi:hypothetical protein